MDILVNIVSDGWRAAAQAPLTWIVVAAVFGAVVYHLTRPG